MQLASVNWFRREDYPALLAIFDDAANFPRTYDDWLKSAERAEQMIRENGMRPLRLILNPNELSAWCAARKCKINGKARNAFARSKFTVRGGQG